MMPANEDGKSLVASRSALVWRGRRAPFRVARGKKQPGAMNETRPHLYDSAIEADRQPWARLTVR